MSIGLGRMPVDGKPRVVPVMGKASAPPWRRQQGALFAGIFVVLAVALSAYFYPLWSAEVIPFDYWRQHMWLPSWI
ncbi:hypothetical protein [Arthrobacter sp. STN4]|uniref:hypothetical protein n=1 Tax=Arthrobacter sp. STN4 TaxID=2923276 RepID=UPI00211A88F5|nr:hypothetical protein [Arthrobacter sp. STN4]MCQ9163606.1 hypothetical protein [Arthrobacter sp. STN4]